MSRKPGRGGQGGGAKQRPARPKKPKSGKGPKTGPKKPGAPSGPHHHGGAGQHGGTRQTHHKHQQSGGGKRGYSLGACSCAAEALAASLRVQGFEVSDRDVLDLYYLTANGPDDGASIGETLAAATETGLAGIRLVSYERAECGPGILGVNVPGPHTVYDDGTCWWSWGGRWPAFADVEERWKVAWGIML